MKKQLLFFVFGTMLCCIAFRLSAQVAVTTDGTAPDNSAMLDVKSNVKGVLMPRMTQSERNAIISPANSLMIYQTDGVPGYYYNAGTTASPLWMRQGKLVLPYYGSVTQDTGYVFSVTSYGSSCIKGEGYIGVIGHTNGTGLTGTGVSGSAYQSSGDFTGVFGASNSADGKGVYGLNWSPTGTAYGVYGESQSTGGTGVYGEGTTGVEAKSTESQGYGVKASCTSTTGSTRAIYGSVSSLDGFSGYFAGGKFTVPNGKVGIGTIYPDYLLDVVGTANLNKGIASGVALRCNGAETIWYNGTYFSWGYGGSYNYFGDEVNIGTSALPDFNLTVNGTACKPGGGSWSVMSDARLKNISGNYDKGLDEIAALQPVKFFYKAGNPFELASDQEQIGFVAQEVQKIFPEAVQQTKSGYLDFNMHPVNVALVNAVKELKAENDRLRVENEQINARLSKIEALVSPTVVK